MIKQFYYIDRCELWGFLPLLRRFNPAEPVVEKSVILCKLKKFREMSLMTLAHNQHDVI
jgi:hypothetical protein